MPFLTAALAKNPKGLALEDEKGALTYGELGEGAGRVANGLRELGVGPGEVVAVAGPFSRGYLEALHGIWKVGCTAAPLNDRWSGPELRRALELLSPSLTLEGGFPLTFERGSIPPPTAEAGSSGGPPSNPVRNPEVVRLLTSGTSGTPAVVGISSSNLRASAEASRERLGLDQGDRWLCSLSPAHVGGLALITRASLLGSGLVSRGPFTVECVIQLLEEGSFTHVSLVPTMLHRLLLAWGDRPAPEGLRLILVGGAPAREELVQAALLAGFPIAVTYGLTEASSQVATAPPWLVKEKPGSVGPPLSGVSIRLDGSGQLLVRGATVAAGQAREDGWLETGDLAREDADGHLWITGRLSDRIISGGVNVDPAEVEDVLESHPAVRAAVVVGVQDPEWGERVVAGVVGSLLEAGFEGELAQLCRSSLSSAKRPRAFKALPAVPRNPNGKVDREAVRALFR